MSATDKPVSAERVLPLEVLNSIDEIVAHYFCGEYSDTYRTLRDDLVTLARQARAALSSAPEPPLLEGYWYCAQCTKKQGVLSGGNPPKCFDCGSTVEWRVSSAPSEAAHVREIPPDPTCSICGAELTPTGYTCKSCGSAPSADGQRCGNCDHRVEDHKYSGCLKPIQSSKARGIEYCPCNLRPSEISLPPAPGGEKA
jgi:hypothetical protein